MVKNTNILGNTSFELGIQAIHILKEKNKIRTSPSTTPKTMNRTNWVVLTPLTTRIRIKLALTKFKFPRAFAARDNKASKHYKLVLLVTEAITQEKKVNNAALPKRF